MPFFTIANFTTLVGLLIAARKLATDPDLLNQAKALGDLAKDGKALAATLDASGLSPLAARMQAAAEEADTAFAHEGADDARRLFWQAAPAALADPAILAAADLDADRATEAMIAAIRASALGRDFAQTPMAEQYFRAVALPNFAALLAETSFVAGIAPMLWRESLTRQGIQLDLLRGLDAKVDALPTRDDFAAMLKAAFDQRAGLEAKEARRAGLTEGRILELARRVADDVTDLDRAFLELERMVAVAIEVQTRGHAGSNSGNFVEAVLARMAELSAQGYDTEAAAEADRALTEWEERQKLEAQQGVTLLEAGLRADILRRDAASAARRIARIGEIGSPDPSQRFQSLRRERRAWYERGRDQGLNFDLEVAIELARLFCAAGRNADQYGAALNDCGIALGTLGDREGGTARLEVAVAVYRKALEEWPRKRVPLDWAAIQNNLGNALAKLGAREGGTVRLEEAVAAYRLALEEGTQDRVPLDWAMTHNNLGAALAMLDECKGGTARLEEAVAAYRAALKERTRDRVPLDWAMTQNNLGAALSMLGGREGGTAQLEEAIAAYRAALEVQTRDRVPLDWAGTQNNLGAALETLGTREGGTTRLEEAVAAYRAALEVQARDRVPLDWAGTQNNLGIALEKLGEREGDTVRLEQSVSAYCAALEERTQNRVPLDWAITMNNLGGVLVRLGERESGTARLEKAVAAFSAALEERTRERVPLGWAIAFGNQGIALGMLAERKSDLAMARQARDQIAEAESVTRASGHGPHADNYARRLSAAEALVSHLSSG